MPLSLIHKTCMLRGCAVWGQTAQRHLGSALTFGGRALRLPAPPPTVPAQVPVCFSAPAASVAVSRTVCRCSHHLLRVFSYSSISPFLPERGVISIALIPLSVSLWIPSLGFRFGSLAGWLVNFVPQHLHHLPGEMVSSQWG